MQPQRMPHVAAASTVDSTVRLSASWQVGIVLENELQGGTRAARLRHHCLDASRWSGGHRMPGGEQHACSPKVRHILRCCRACAPAQPGHHGILPHVTSCCVSFCGAGTSGASETAEAGTVEASGGDADAAGDSDASVASSGSGISVGASVAASSGVMFSHV